MKKVCFAFLATLFILTAGCATVQNPDGSVSMGWAQPATDAPPPQTAVASEYSQPQPDEAPAVEQAQEVAPVPEPQFGVPVYYTAPIVVGYPYTSFMYVQEGGFVNLVFIDNYGVRHTEYWNQNGRRMTYGHFHEWHNNYRVPRSELSHRHIAERQKAYKAAERKHEAKSANEKKHEAKSEKKQDKDKAAKSDNAGVRKDKVAKDGKSGKLGDKTVKADKSVKEKTTKIDKTNKNNVAKTDRGNKPVAKIDKQPKQQQVLKQKAAKQPANKQQNNDDKKKHQ